MKHPGKNRGRKVAITAAVSVALLALGATSLLSGDGSASATRSLKSMASKASPWTLASLNDDSRASASDIARLQQSLQQLANGEVTVTDNRATGTPSMVSVGAGGDLYPRGAKAVAPATKVSQFLAENGAMFGITDSTRQLKLLDSKQDQYGNSRVSYQQVHEGVPVFGAVLRGHVSLDGRLTAVNGTFVPDVAVSTVASVSQSDAYQTAITTVARQQPSAFKTIELTPKSTSLVVYRTGLTNAAKGDNYLAYEVQVTGNNVREFVYVDALTGKVVDQITGVYGAKQRELYQGAYFEGATPVWKEGDLRPDPSFTHEDEISGTGYTYNLFFNLSNGTYRSWDGNNAPMRTVDTDPTIVCPNANWNGTTTNYCIATAADDVVGHEWAHAYTQETSGLIYSYQSGALNESYSDIFGETVDLLNNRDMLAGSNNPALAQYGDNRRRSDQDRVCSNHNNEGSTGDNSVRWLMGEDALAFAGLPPFGDPAIRDMWHPKCSGGTAFFGDPGHVNSPRYHCAASDAGGVHVNSAINNRAYALLVDGDIVTDKDNSTNATPVLFANPVTVTGIGLTKAAHIFWRANSVYNTPSTNFAANAANLLQACQDLKGLPLTKLVTTAELVPQFALPTHPGNNDTIEPTPETWNGVETWGGETRTYSSTITDGDCAQVQNAINAVEMTYDVSAKCGFSAPLDPAPAPMCNGATVRSRFMENWENGMPAGWTIGQEAFPKTAGLDTRPWFRRGNLPNGKAGSAMYQEDRKDLGNCSSDDESGVLYMISPEITVDATSPSFLVFEHYFLTEGPYDGGNLLISINGSSFGTIPTPAIQGGAAPIQPVAAIIPSSAFVHNPYNATLNIDAPNTNPKRGQQAFTGANPINGTNNWGQSQIDLAKAGVVPGDKIRIRWDFGQDGCNGNDGWYVDRVEVFSCGEVVTPPPSNCTSYQSNGGTGLFDFLVPSVTTASVSGATGNVTDVNIRKLKGSHTWMGDLTFTLTSPDGTELTLFDGAACSSEAWNGAVGFDDDAAKVAGCGDWNVGGDFRAHQALSVFNGEDPNGDWTLTIEDGFPGDSGSLEGWEVQLCKAVVPPPSDEGGDFIKGSGWLLDSIGEKINFHVDARARKGSKAAKGSKGPYKGHLHLNDKAADVKIKVEEWTYVGPVTGGECGGILNGTNTIELRGFGEFGKNLPATFRVCAEDNGNYGYGKSSKGSKGSKVYSTKPDRFAVQCLTGCTYSTMSRGDNMMDSGNLDVRTEATPPAAAPSGGSSSQGSASTVFLDPNLVDQALIGSVQVFTVNVYGSNQLPLTGQSVSLTSVSADGSTKTVQGIADTMGTVLFSLPVAMKVTEYVASSGGVHSNAVKLKPVVNLN